MSRIKFSDHTPFEIQAEIMKRLPVKSLVRFRSVAKPWKSLIDSSKFVNDHHIRQTQTQPPHIIVSYDEKAGPKCVSLVDDVTFPNHKFSHIVPEPIQKFEYLFGYGSSKGVLCFFGYHQDRRLSMAVLWNLIVRKSVCVIIPTLSSATVPVVGFGVCDDTSDPKIVKIDVIHKKGTVHWEVGVFTLSSRVWKSLSINPSFKLCRLMWFHVFVEGFVYWLGYDGINQDDGISSNFIISFDLEGEEFGEVSLPRCLEYSADLRISKLNETLVVVDYYQESVMSIFDAWIMIDGVTKSFTKKFSIKSMYDRRVKGFRKNGEAIMQIIDDDVDVVGDGDRDGYDGDDDDDGGGGDDDDEEITSMLQVYEPCSGHINAIGIKGQHNSFCVFSYTETLILLNQSDSIIH